MSQVYLRAEETHNLHRGLAIRYLLARGMPASTVAAMLGESVTEVSELASRTGHLLELSDTNGVHFSGQDGFGQTLTFVALDPLRPKQDDEGGPVSSQSGT